MPFVSKHKLSVFRNIKHSGQQSCQFTNPWNGTTAKATASNVAPSKNAATTEPGPN